jgi:LysR family hydrogen peroxide-inducible transcriptional activator
MLTLRQLRYLETLARHRHFGRAPEECAVTPPAVSMQIRDLERIKLIRFAEPAAIEPSNGERLTI